MSRPVFRLAIAGRFLANSEKYLLTLINIVNMNTRPLLPTAFTYLCSLLVALCAFPLGVHADTPINSVPTTISSPGRYFLTMNLSSNNSSKNAITIEADDVTIDFQDHTISGLGAGIGTNANGISAINRRNITIKNGTLTGFKIAIALQRGLSAGAGNNASNAIENMRLNSNTYGGVLIEGGVGCRIEQCQITRTGGTFSGVDAFGISLPFTSAVARDNQISTVFATIGSSFGIICQNSNATLLGNHIDTCINGITVTGNVGQTKFLHTLTANVARPFNGGVDAGHNN